MKKKLLAWQKVWVQTVLSIGHSGDKKKDPSVVKKRCPYCMKEHMLDVYPCMTSIHLSLILGFFKCLPFHVCLANSSETWLCYTDLDMLFLHLFGNDDILFYLRKVYEEELFCLKSQKLK